MDSLEAARAGVSGVTAALAGFNASWAAGRLRLERRTARRAAAGALAALNYGVALAALTVAARQPDGALAWAAGFAQLAGVLALAALIARRRAR
ncbi:MAG TPA: hypothetical protein VFC53_12485 [Dehalococcoidia bacterium]|nr:hypothetical protein [Dehalococcoidia bacterium]